MALRSLVGRAASTESVPLPELPASARGEAVFEDDVPQLVARLLLTDAPEPRVGVLFDLAPGWHLYWRNPGGTGIAPELDLAVPGHRVGAIAWPAPRTFREADGLFTTFGYEGSVLLSAPLESTGEIAATGPDDAAIVTADVSVLICRTECVPASFSLSTPLARARAATERRVVSERFRETLSRVPATAETLGIAPHARWLDEKDATTGLARVALSLADCDSTRAGAAPSRDATRAGAADDDCAALAPDPSDSLFLPMDEGAFELRRAEALGAHEMGTKRALALTLEPFTDELSRLRGLVYLKPAKGEGRHVAIDVAIDAPDAEMALAAPGANGPPTEDAPGWLRIVLLAMLGGLILNGMPCVLPVLAIKVVAVADLAQKDRREVRLHGLVYTAGVLGSMGLLAAIVLGLRAAGHSVGWGFQFQEPLFVAVISAVLVTFALNLFGVFEIDLGQSRLASVGQDSTGLSRSLFEGLLAVVLATPCTAPFLGTAVGFAFASEGSGIVAIFLAIGLGLASPFLAVSFFPRLARFVPRSGPWMLKLRAGLGFCLLATVVWLLWILGQTGGANAVVAMAGLLLFLAFLLWGFGQLQPLRSPWLARAIAVGIAGLALTGFNRIDFDRAPAAGSDEAAAESHDGDWQTYSEEAVRQVLAEGRPAFVVFTADWCITCQVNERTVLHRDAVRDALAQGDYALFVGDWTRRDEAIRRTLARFGRAGVPLYLVYSPEAPDAPRVLPELLTQALVVEALEPTSRLAHAR
ncbi:MAG: thioredoxin family protein [Spirochaetaceae bacterium]|nr:thioredoxin family protein [Myxococcales bacterium]MCB9726474.1 thioredoxin family protein [Spirochaetaceae bacterium]